MKEELLPVIIVIAILGILYLALRSINRKRKNRLGKSRFHRSYK